MSASVAILTVVSAAHAAAYLYAAPEHVIDGSWPLHARFHVLQALLWIVGLDAAVIAIARGPFAAGTRWARWALLAAWPLAHGAYFIALAVFPGGGPPELSSHLVLGALLAAYGVGLASGWRTAR